MFVEFGVLLSLQFTKWAALYGNLIARGQKWDITSLTLKVRIQAFSTAFRRPSALGSHRFLVNLHEAQITSQASIASYRTPRQELCEVIACSTLFSCPNLKSRYLEKVSIGGVVYVVLFFWWTSHTNKSLIYIEWVVIKLINEYKSLNEDPIYFHQSNLGQVICHIS